MDNSEEYPNKYKKCKQCGITKLLSAFYKQSRNKTDGRTGTCKKCREEYSTKYRLENRIRMRERDRAKYEAMSAEERASYIKKKSKLNQLRFKTNEKSLEKRNNYLRSPRQRYSAYRNESKRRSRSYSFTLTFDEFSNIISKPCYICNRTEEEFGGKMGIDRVDNSVGYELDNCQPCCKPCNDLKNNRTLEYVLKHVKDIYNHQSSLGNM